jgi:hypothetical protein
MVRDARQNGRIDRQLHFGTNAHRTQPLDFCRAMRYGFFVNEFEKVRTFHEEPTSPGRPSSVPRFPKPSLASVMQTHRSSSLPISTPGERLPAAVLPGTAQYVECDVTHSKQRTGKFLPGATTERQRIRFHRNFHVKNHANKSKRPDP